MERSAKMITLNKEDAFTIVDIISKAQEVIRCKDCTHRKKNKFCLHNMRYEADEALQGRK